LTQVKRIGKLALQATDEGQAPMDNDQAFLFADELFDLLSEAQAEAGRARDLLKAADEEDRQLAPWELADLRRATETLRVKLNEAQESAANLWCEVPRSAAMAARGDARLLPGERLAANGVIIGSGAEPGIPRFGADANDIDHPAQEG
jgi:hypothetical protein